MKLFRLAELVNDGQSIQDDNAHTLDHVPATAADDKRQARQLARARRRHGKPFRTHQPVTRQTAPSRLLEELNAKSRPATAPSTIVTPIGKKASAR